jgi:hypothetical protein
MEWTNARLKVEVVACSLMALLLIATPTMADAVLPANFAARDLARCELDAERLYPAPDNKGFENWPERRSNLEKQAQNIETCRWLAGYRDTVHALRHPEVLERAAGCDAGIFVFDFAKPLFWTISGQR